MGIGHLITLSDHMNSHDTTSLGVSRSSGGIVLISHECNFTAQSHVAGIVVDEAACFWLFVFIMT
jgi:hypothetical protein